MDELYNDLLTTKNIENAYTNNYYQYSLDSIDNKEDVSSINDYISYFDEYNFDWDKINNDEACTFHIPSIKQKICVQNKDSDGFVITFHPSNPSNNRHAAHSDLTNFYSNIELDFDNDADWSFINTNKHILNNNNILNQKYMNDILNIIYAKQLLDNTDTLNNRRHLLNNYYSPSIPMVQGEPFTDEMADTLQKRGLNNLYGMFQHGYGNMPNTRYGMLGALGLPKQPPPRLPPPFKEPPFVPIHPPPKLPPPPPYYPPKHSITGHSLKPILPLIQYPPPPIMNPPLAPPPTYALHPPHTPAPPQPPQIIYRPIYIPIQHRPQRNRGEIHELRDEARNGVHAIKHTMQQAQNRLNKALLHVHQYISTTGDGMSKMQNQLKLFMQQMEEQKDKIKEEHELRIQHAAVSLKKIEDSVHKELSKTMQHFMDEVDKFKKEQDTLKEKEKKNKEENDKEKETDDKESWDKFKELLQKQQDGDKDGDKKPDPYANRLNDLLVQFLNQLNAKNNGDEEDKDRNDPFLEDEEDDAISDKKEPTKKPTMKPIIEEDPADEEEEEEKDKEPKGPMWDLMKKRQKALRDALKKHLADKAKQMKRWSIENQRRMRRAIKAIKEKHAGLKKLLIDLKHQKAQLLLKKKAGNKHDRPMDELIELAHGFKQNNNDNDEFKQILAALALKKKKPKKQIQQHPLQKHVNKYEKKYQKYLKQYDKYYRNWNNNYDKQREEIVPVPEPPPPQPMQQEEEEEEEQEPESQYPMMDEMGMWNPYMTSMMNPFMMGMGGMGNQEEEEEHDRPVVTHMHIDHGDTPPKQPAYAEHQQAAYREGDDMYPLRYELRSHVHGSDYVDDVFTEKCQPMQGVEVCGRYNHDQNNVRLTVRVAAGKRLRDGLVDSDAVQVIGDTLKRFNDIGIDVMYPTYDMMNKMNAIYNDDDSINDLQDIKSGRRLIDEYSGYYYDSYYTDSHWDNDYQTGTIDMSDFGDMLGYSHWREEIINEDDNSNNNYDKYGAYQYYSNEFNFDYNNDDNWDIINPATNTKCSLILPALFQRICMHYIPQKNNIKIHFDTASVDEINDILNINNDNSYSAVDISAMRNILNDEYDDILLNYNNDNEWDEINNIHNGMKSDTQFVLENIISKCKNTYISSICIQNKLNTPKFGMKIKVASNKRLLLRAMRINKLLQKYKSTFANLIASFFKELHQTIYNKKGLNSYKFVNNAAKNINKFDNLLFNQNGYYYYYDDDGDDDQYNINALKELEYDALSAEFYEEFGLMSSDAFNDNNLWDTIDILGTNYNHKNIKIIKKCRKTLGLNWCYCETKQISKPFACFGNEINDQNILNKQISSTKQLYYTAKNVYENYFDN